jgi:hypothetical protein
MVPHETVCTAISRGVCIELSYDGYARVVEAHACGITKEGHTVMRVWQVRGGSVHHEPIGWKLLRLDETRGVHLLAEKALAPRTGYRRGDKAMQRIYCQV